MMGAEREWEAEGGFQRCGDETGVVNGLESIVEFPPTAGAVVLETSD
jgi:hypothetical protein